MKNTEDLCQDLYKLYQVSVSGPMLYLYLSQYINPNAPGPLVLQVEVRSDCCPSILVKLFGAILRKWTLPKKPPNGGQGSFKEEELDLLP